MPRQTFDLFPLGATAQKDHTLVRGCHPSRADSATTTRQQGPGTARHLPITVQGVLQRVWRLFCGPHTNLVICATSGHQSPIMVEAQRFEHAGGGWVQVPQYDTREKQTHIPVHQFRAHTKQCASHQGILTHSRMRNGAFDCPQGASERTTINAHSVNKHNDASTKNVAAKSSGNPNKGTCCVLQLATHTRTCLCPKQTDFQKCHPANMRRKSTPLREQGG